MVHQKSRTFVQDFFFFPAKQQGLFVLNSPFILMYRLLLNIPRVYNGDESCRLGRKQSLPAIHFTQ